MSPGSVVNYLRLKTLVVRLDHTLNVKPLTPTYIDFDAYVKTTLSNQLWQLGVLFSRGFLWIPRPYALIGVSARSPVAEFQGKNPKCFSLIHTSKGHQNKWRTSPRYAAYLSRCTDRPNGFLYE